MNPDLVSYKVASEPARSYSARLGLPLANGVWFILMHTQRRRLRNTECLNKFADTSELLYERLQGSRRAGSEFTTTSTSCTNNWRETRTLFRMEEDTACLWARNPESLCIRKDLEAQLTKGMQVNDIMKGDLKIGIWLSKHTAVLPCCSVLLRLQLQWDNSGHHLTWKL